jgi:hypothetical protein
MKKIVCGGENVKEFNAALRQHLPEFHAQVKALYQAGLIPGLAGATLEFAPFDAGEIKTQAPTLVENFCRDCRHFQRDTIGFGDGLGQCAVGGHKNKLKWPGQDACHLFGEKQ